MLATALRFQMVKQNANLLAKAKQKAAEAKPGPSARKAKHSDSSSCSDELEKANVSSSDEEKVPKKSEKKTDVPEERRAQLINQFTFSVYINMI